MQELLDGALRLAAIAQANNLLAAWGPQKFNVNRVITDLAHRQLVGYRRPALDNRLWQYADIDIGAAGAAALS